MHHNPKQRQRELLKRTLIYAIMTISVISLVVLSLFLVLGYNVDGDGPPEQGGLVQFRSFPTDAEISIDGSKQSIKTNSKKNLSAGYHNVSMSLKDYRGWSKSFDLGSGELLWLNALLVPSRITTSEVTAFEQIASMKVSPDKKWIAIIEKPQDTILKIVDIRDEKKPKITQLAIPENVVKANPGDISKIVEWDFGSRYILLTRTNGTKTDWIRLDRSDPSGARNVTALKNLNISDAHFVGTSGNVLQVLAAGVVQRVDISRTDEKISSIAQNVREFELYNDDRVGFVGTKDTALVVGYYNDFTKKSRTIRTYPQDQPNVHNAITSYFNDDYQAISHGTTIDIIKNPLEENRLFASFELQPGVQWLYFSNSGRFVVAQNGSSLSVYDLERKQNFVYTIPNNPPYTLGHHLKWLDDFHLVSDLGGVLTVFEYDGTNIETIGNVAPGHDMSLSNNGKRLFDIGINSVTQKPVLQSAVMVIE